MRSNTLVHAPDAPRCSWLQRMIDSELDRRRVADLVVVRPAELENLRKSHLERGYDPYNTAALQLPTWIRSKR
jgi:hypothetical protein